MCLWSEASPHDLDRVSSYKEGRTFSVGLGNLRVDHESGARLQRTLAAGERAASSVLQMSTPEDKPATGVTTAHVEPSAAPPEGAPIAVNNEPPSKPKQPQTDLPTQLPVVVDTVRVEEDFTRVPDHVRGHLEPYWRDGPHREKQLREWGLVERADKLKNWRHDLSGYMCQKDCEGHDHVPRHERVTKPEEERMHLNGETKAMMDHVKKRWKDRNYDTSKDEPWCVDEQGNARPDGDPSLVWKDSCVWVWTVFWMAPKMMAMFLPMYLLSGVPILVMYIYISYQEAGLDKLERNGTFWFVLTFAFLTYLPVIALAAISLWLDYVMYYLFGFIFTLLTCRWRATWRSHRAIDPFRNGPSTIKVIDIFCCIAGQTMRHGCAGTMYNVTMMWLLIPWLKYFWNCNPWVYDLDERYIQQISTSMRDLGDVDMGGIDNICDTARKIISRSKQYWYLRLRQDYWHFVPHYPYPPPHRRWAVGMQCGGSNSTPVCFTLLVHTTHADSDNGGSSEQFVLSNSVHPGGKPVYRVMLWYNNPYHFLTGFVEASISNGGLSQPSKFNGGEHPMWLVTGKSPLVCGRDSLTGSGMIDKFFDEWLPLFVHECRQLSYFAAKQHEMAMQQWNTDQFEGMTPEKFRDWIKIAVEVGAKYADKHYEEVFSKDGISACTGKTGREAYDGKDILTIQNSQKSHYMDLQHQIVGAGADRERLLLYDRLLKNMKQSAQERKNLRHILDLNLDSSGTDIRASVHLERKWTETTRFPSEPCGAEAEQLDEPECEETPQASDEAALERSQM